MKAINLHHSLKQFKIAVRFKLFLIFFMINIGHVFSMTLSKSNLPKDNSNLSHSDGVFLNAEIVNGELFIDLPISVLDKPFLWIRYDNDTFYHQNKYVIFTKQKDYVFLELPPIQSQAGIIIPNEGGGDRKNILGRFRIEENEDNLAVLRVNITDLLFDPTLWENKNVQIIKQNSFVDGISFYKDESVIQTIQTTVNKGKTSISYIDFGFYQLPKPMHHRLFDHRMGFFTEDRRSPINHNTINDKGNISRWRLEKMDPHKELNVPVKPITFVLSPKIPKKWRQYVKAGILEWMPAFEAAGFKNALLVKEVSDTTIIQNNIGTSVVRWNTDDHIRGKENESGSTVSTIIDLRSGEILKADIIIGTSLQNLSDRYFIRCAPIDIRAHHYPFPDDLMGELIQSLIAHETGHAFGIKDANYGEYTYPFEKMRDKKWLEKMGHTPSIMNYTRHNNLLQQEDKIPPSLLIQKVGPADIYQIKWGYSVFQGNNENESMFLENLIRQQDTIPWYRYNISRYEIRGPGATDEVVDNADPLKSVKLALKNIKNVIMLLSNPNKEKINDVHSQRLYEKTLDLWYNQMRQVVSLVGGYTIQYKSGAQQGNVFTPIPKEKQIQAIDFLIEHVFTIPDWLSSPEVVERTGYTISNDKISNLQTRLLLELLESYRMNRLQYMEQKDMFKGLTTELLLKLQEGLFLELNTGSEKNDFRRLDIQVIYIEKVLSIINEESLNSKLTKKLSYYNQATKSNYINQLNLLRKRIEESLMHDNDSIIHWHFYLLLQQINEKLN